MGPSASRPTTTTCMLPVEESANRRYNACVGENSAISVGFRIFCPQTSRSSRVNSEASRHPPRQPHRPPRGHLPTRRAVRTIPSPFSPPPSALVCSPSDELARNRGTQRSAGAIPATPPSRPYIVPDLWERSIRPFEMEAMDFCARGYGRHLGSCDHRRELFLLGIRLIVQVPGRQVHQQGWRQVHVLLVAYMYGQGSPRS